MDTPDADPENEPRMAARRWAWLIEQQLHQVFTEEQAQQTMRWLAEALMELVEEYAREHP